MERLPMRESLVNKQLNQIEDRIIARRSGAFFKERISELNSLRMNLLHQEQQVYKIFNVHDINELNQKISQYTGLARLGGYNLAKELEGLKSLQTKKTDGLDDIFSKIINSPQFQTIVNNNLQQNDWNDALEDIAAEFANTLNQQGGHRFQVARSGSRKSNKSFGLTKLLKNIFIDASGKLDFKRISKKNFSPQFIQELRRALGMAKVVEQDSGAQAEIILQSREKYAGWKYTIEELKADPSLEGQIRESILQMCLRIMNGTAIEQEAFTRAFQRMPSSSLFVYNTAQVQGAIGEVALGAYVDLLTGGQTGIQIGDVKNQLNNNGQIAIDFLLSNYGFQVKNYNEFAYGFPNSIVLSRTNLLSTWEEKFDLDASLTQMLDVFYGLRWYNIKYEDPYADTEARILNMEKNLNEFYAKFPDKILRLYEDINGASIFNGSLLQGRFYNTFYFVSGKRFIPSSSILEKIINYFEYNFYQDSSLRQEVYSSSSYNGFDIRDFKGKGKYEDAPSHKAVSGKVSITINWRLYLDDFLKEF